MAKLAPLLRGALPGALIVYGGVFPTYHWREVLSEEAQIDVLSLADALSANDQIAITSRDLAAVAVLPAAPVFTGFFVFG